MIFLLDIWNSKKCSKMKKSQRGKNPTFRLKFLAWNHRWILKGGLREPSLFIIQSSLHKVCSSKFRSKHTYCGSTIDSLRNSYFILQICHPKSFKMRYIRSLHLNFSLGIHKNAWKHLKIFCMNSPVLSILHFWSFLFLAFCVITFEPVKI